MVSSILTLVLLDDWPSHNEYTQIVSIGPQSEVMFWLQTFGIPTKLMPLTNEGEVVHDENIAMWEKRRAFERSSRTTHVVIECHYGSERWLATVLGIYFLM
jgi:hypothetical protein